MATLRCAGYNIRVNLPELANKKDQEAIQADLQRMLSRGTSLNSRAALLHVVREHQRAQRRPDRQYGRRQNFLKRRSRACRC